jgi:dTDP-4-dehydrorhamnose reductase
VALRSLRGRQPFLAAGGVIVSPTYVPDLVHTTLDLVIDGERGVWHLANRGALSWAELVRKAAALAGLDTTLVREGHASELGWIAPRPVFSALGTERGVIMPALEDSLERFVQELSVSST